MHGLSNLIYGSAELISQLENGNIAHDTELWDSNYYMLLLSGYSRHFETDDKVLSLFLEFFTCFIKKHPLEGQSVKQFPTILGVGSYVWNLLQAISEAGWDCFKVLLQFDALTLMEAIRT